MTMKRLFFALSVCVPMWGFPMGSSAPRRVEVLVVPARPNAVRVGMDLRERRGVVLLAYAPESDASAPFLHVWDGRAWVRVPARRYADGSFLTQRPARVWVAGADNAMTSSLIERAAEWTPEVLNVSAYNVTEFINAMGRSMDFSSADWKWFANAYSLELKDLNREVRPPSWYDAHRASDLPPAEHPLRVLRKNREGAATSSLEPIPMPEPDESAAPEPPAGESRDSADPEVEKLDVEVEEGGDDQSFSVDTEE